MSAGVQNTPLVIGTMLFQPLGGKSKISSPKMLSYKIFPIQRLQFLWECQ